MLVFDVRRAARVAPIMLLGLALAGPGQAERESKVSATKHNLSASGSGTTKSSVENQVCVFCHTPHGAEASTISPLWNKTLANKTYTLYTSPSLDATQIAGRSAEQPMGSSKLCLSCHDGAMALGSVRVLRGQTNQIIGGGTEFAMPAGSGVSTGFTRNLGGASTDDLANDHPISITYDATLATRDGELRNNSGANQSWGTVLGKRVKGGPKFLLPLEPTGSVVGAEGQVQCITCHDPHIRETASNEGNIKFLRANRFQKAQPTAIYSVANDIICLACHDKGLQGDGNSWAYSAHANSNVATQTYSDAAANTREFPLAAVTGTSNLKVWQAACLNCHDTHTIAGANKLLREGTFANAAALEQTCYQCHSTTGATTLTSATGVPNIGSEFALIYRMPIASADQDAGSEVHAIGGNFNNSYVDCTHVGNKCGADGVEDRVKLGVTISNRHAECADCHNPHRVVKFQKFYGANGNITGTPDGAATHTHTDTAMTHTNVASGALRGTTGVEPMYSSLSFHSAASNYTLRRGDPGADFVPNDSNPDIKTYVTREYQVCLKCHSRYAYSTPPNLRAAGLTKGLTPSGTNGLTVYTDQAKEFQAPATHANEPLNLGDEAGAVGGTLGGAIDTITNNHRSWHPVMGVTGRTAAKRNSLTGSAFNAPWSTSVGAQTLYCSDCHGGNTATGSVIPATGKPWGPHGSDNPFILKGAWDTSTGSGQESTGLCFKCHSYSFYATKDGGGRSGFGGPKSSNLHGYHADKIGKMRCSWCHIAVPHGWKNKALLVNLNDVGAEVGVAGGTQVRNGTTALYSRSPYYMGAINKIRSFAQSGSWADTNCGSKGAPGNAKSGRDWMRDSTENCASPP